MDGEGVVLDFLQICARDIRQFVGATRYRSTMGRPKRYLEHRISTAVRLPLSLHSQLLEEATARDVSVNLLVTRAVADFLGKLPSGHHEVKTDPGKSLERESP